MAIQATGGSGAAVYSAQNSKANAVSERPQAAADRPAPATKDTNSSGSKGSILNPKDRVEISHAALSQSQDREESWKTVMTRLEMGERNKQKWMDEAHRRSAVGIREAIKSHQDQLAMLERTEPVPAVKLNDDEVQAVIKALKETGSHPSFLSNEDNNFILGDQLYSFKPDGSVYRNENGVPTSEEQRQGWIEAGQESIKDLRSMLEEWGV